MLNYLLWFIIGAVCGAIIGLFIAAVCIAAGGDDDAE